MSKCDLMRYSQEDREEMLKIFGRTLKSVQDDINCIKEWLQMQPHLPPTNDTIIEKFLYMNKFSFEKTKMRLDMYYTIRTILPEFYDANMFSENYDTMDNIYIFPLPKLDEQYRRAFVMRLRTEYQKEFDPSEVFSHIMALSEIRVLNDYCAGDIHIYDVKGMSLHHLRKVTPMVIKKLIIVLEKVYGGNLKQMHFVNVPPFLHAFCVMVKSMMKKKLADRVEIHENTDSLLTIVSKKILPKEFGGEEESLEILNEKWKKYLIESKDVFDALRRVRADESLRPGKPINSDILGFYGNFRKLDVD